MISMRIQVDVLCSTEKAECTALQERLYARADRLAPGEYTHEAATVATRRAEYEAQAAEAAEQVRGLEAHACALQTTPSPLFLL